MRIYKVNIEHRKYGMNWSHENVSGRTFYDVVRKVKKLLKSGERIESVELVATAEE